MNTTRTGSSNKEVSANDAVVVLLECGSSLAEQEHAPSHDNNDHNMHNHNNIDDDNDDAASREHRLLRLLPEKNGSDCGDCDGGKLSTVEALRSAIASDVLTGNVNTERQQQHQSYTTFTSPFAVPKQRQQQQTTTTTSGHHRFLELPLVYCDQTASNRPVQSMERYIQTICLPLYGNTHTNTSITGAQSTAFCAETRQVIAEEVNAKITGKASLDIVLFAGNGATSAVELLIDCLGLKHAAAAAAAAANGNTNNNNTHRPIVFVGPYEHHSNLVTWRETGSEIVQIPECPVTRNVDLVVLEQQLQYYQEHCPNDTLKMGTFTAASNVTGKLCDTLAIAALLHRYQTLAFFDYATAAPYTTSRMEMDMNPTVPPTAAAALSSSEYPNDDVSACFAKDAMFISPHKMLGGSTGTPGILVVKKHLVSQINAPNKSGGGTVFYVAHDHHRFLSNRVERYEGGTPHIVGIIRAGLTFLYKRQVEQHYARIVAAATSTSNTNVATTTTTTTFTNNSDSGNKNDKDKTITNQQSSSSLLPRTIFDHDCMTHQRVVSYLTKHAPNLILLGVNNNNDENGTSSSCSNKHLPIFSFLIQWGRRFLHFNYVSAILNDLFGIQSRGGCQCAGPYSQSLLGLTEMVTASSSNTSTKQQQQRQEMPNARNKAIEAALVQYKERAELLRPGYTRISLPFKGLHSFEIDYVLKTLVWVSKHAWELMPQYRVNHRTGEWRHYNRQGKPLGSERRWLSHVDFFAGEASSTANTSTATAPVVDLQTRLDQALVDADFILQAARTDQKNIVQALKMTDAESILGGGDDSFLEELRWYVYPRECADAMTNSAINNSNDSSGSGCSSNGKLLGALNPGSTGVSNATVTDHVGKELDGAGLPSTSTGDNDASQSTTCCAVAENNVSSGDDTKVLLFFRDGEHSGEAPLFEIKSGWEEGELSDACHVFNPESDEWMPIQRFLDSSSSSILADKSSAAFENGNKSATAKVCTFSKKEARDNTAWGRGNVMSTTAQSSTTVTGTVGTGSYREQKMEVKRHASPTLPTPGATIVSKKARFRHVKPPPKMMRLMTQAIVQWEMLKEGDRLLLGLSGGKDSLSLLHCLLEFQRKLPIMFEIEVCTIDPMTPSFSPAPLIPYVESLGLKYHYIRDDIVARANSAGKDGKMVSSLCAFCARMKRGMLYATARKHKCNKLVLAQHLDDCAESFMMSVMHNGFLRTMKANYQIEAGAISVIRPMVYCRESLMSEFAKSANLPVINENCPACFEEPKERARVKKLLSREELNYPNFYDNMRRSLMPLMHEDSESILRCVTEEALAKSRKKIAPTNGKNSCHSQGKGTSVGPDSAGEVCNNVTCDGSGNGASTKLLCDASDAELALELARRKARRAERKTEASTTAQSVCNTPGACSLFD